MECVLGVDGQARDLGAVHLQRAGDVAGLLAVAVQGERDQICRREVYGVPFQNDGGLGGIAAAEDRGGGKGGAKGVVDLILEGLEALLGSVFLGGVSSDGDVDDGT